MKNFSNFVKMCFMIIFFASAMNVIIFAEGPDITSAGTSTQQTTTPEVSASTQVAPSQTNKKSFNLRSSDKSSTTVNDSSTKVNTPTDNSTINSQNKVNSAQSSTQARAAVSSSTQAVKSQSSASTASSTTTNQNEPTQQNSHAPAITTPPQQKSNPTQAVVPSSPQSQAEPTKAESDGEKSSAEVASTKTTTGKSEEKSQVPEDLPKVDSSELDFPEVVTPSSAQEQTGSINYWAGLIGWACLLIGVAIIIFVMLKGRSNPEMPVQKIHGSKKIRHKKKHLLSDNYYRDKF